MRRNPGAAALALVLLLAAAAGKPGIAGQRAVGLFSAMEPGGVPAPWQLTRLGDRPATRYRLVEQGGTVVVEAEADASVAALVRKLDVDPADYPVLRWRWKVSALVAESDLARKSGDDYPARVYVTFDYDTGKLPWLTRMKLRAARLVYGEDVPAAALSYVWARRAPEDTIVPNAFTERVRMVVAESGSARVGEWVGETRNIVDDYRAAFGEDPPPVSGISITTDTDNTGGYARAWYGDIVLEGS